MLQQNQAITMDQNIQVKWQLVIKPMMIGLMGIWTLFSIHLGLLIYFSPLELATKQALLTAPWAIPLLLGLGIQLTLYSYIKGYGRLSSRGKARKEPVIVSFGASAGTLLACCLRFAAVALPLAGIPSLVLLARQQQTGLMLIAILVNLAGIFYLLRHIGKKNLAIENGNLTYLSFVNSIAAFCLLSLIPFVVLMIAMAQ